MKHAMKSTTRLLSEWLFMRKYTTPIVNLDLAYTHDSIDHHLILSIANPYNAFLHFGAKRREKI